MPTVQKLHVAYLALEFGVDERLPIYAGGLGALAGDVVLQAQQENLPLHAVGLCYQLTKDQLQTAGFSLLDNQVVVEVDNQAVVVRAWQKKYGTAQLLLLDPEGIKGSLYDPDRMVFLRQQIILGIGAVRLLNQLGTQVAIYHLNEGHTSLALLELKSSPGSTRVVATKHTIFTGAGLYLSREEFDSALGLYFKTKGLEAKEIDELFHLGTHPKHPATFSTTKFLLCNAQRVSGVSQLHTEFEKKTHPESILIPITNGVCQKRWQVPEFTISDVVTMTDQTLWHTHLKHKQILFDQIREKTALSLDSNKLTIVWARRLVDYKRPDLIFKDITRLIKIVCHPNRPVQFLLAGRVGADTVAVEKIVQLIESTISRVELNQKIVFWPNYDLAVARYLVSGADVWLNTPKLGFEACGTSGMKAGLNGVLQFSVADGWYQEVNWEGIGWTLPEESIEKRVYEILENEIVPTYYDQDKLGLSQKWLDRMKRTIDVVKNNYTTSRMLRDYEKKLYR